MARWRKAMLAASVGIAASTFAATPATADTVSLVVDYSCTGGIAGPGPVTLRARVNIPTSVQVGGMLNLGTSIQYTGNPRFVSPGYFKAGAKVSLEGSVKLQGAWNGELEPRGSQDQPRLKPDAVLAVPEGISSSANLTEEGVVKLTPQALTVDFVPPAGQEVVNDDEPGRVAYESGPWAYDGSTPVEYHDHLRDVHTANNAGAAARIVFRGTGFEYIGRRMPGAGRVEILLDGVHTAEVDPTKTEGGQPTNATRGNVTLWQRDDLDYKQHTVEIRNIEDKPIYLDAFKLLTREMINPPTEHRSTCTITNNPGSVEVTVKAGGSTDDPSDSPSPSDSPTSDDPPDDDGGDDNPLTSPSPSPSPAANSNGNNNVGVLVMPGNGSTTSTATPKPTSTRYVVAQVASTPKGGVATGEAPEPGGVPYALVLVGSVLLAGCAGGGLLVRRRRAEHAGGAKS